MEHCEAVKKSEKDWLRQRVDDKIHKGLEMGKDIWEKRSTV